MTQDPAIEAAVPPGIAAAHPAGGWPRLVPRLRVTDRSSVVPSGARTALPALTCAVVRPSRSRDDVERDGVGEGLHVATGHALHPEVDGDGGDEHDHHHAPGHQHGHAAALITRAALVQASSRADTSQVGGHQLTSISAV